MALAIHFLTYARSKENNRKGPEMAATPAIQSPMSDFKSIDEAVSMVGYLAAR